MTDLRRTRVLALAIVASACGWAEAGPGQVSLRWCSGHLMEGSPMEQTHGHWACR